MNTEKSGYIIASLILGICHLTLSHNPMGGGALMAGHDRGCNGCQRQRQRATMTENEIRNLQISLIKLKILRGLNLEAPPVVNMTQQDRIPLPMRTEMFGTGQQHSRRRMRRHRPSQTEDGASSIEKVAITAEQNKIHGHHTAESSIKTYHFSISEKLFGHGVRRAHLWLYLMPRTTVKSNQTSVLYVSDTNGKNQWTTEKPGVPGVIVTKTEVLDEGWVDLDVTDAIKEWIHRTHRHQTLSVSVLDHIKSKTKGVPVLDTDGFTPFLIIHANKPRKRIRRNVNNCNNGRCCRAPLRVDMREIGWDSWLKQPPYYDAYYCRGSCEYGSNLQVPQYANALRDYLQRFPAASSEISPCCAAVHMSSISILYVDDHGRFHNTEVDNMRVDSCECR